MNHADEGFVAARPPDHDDPIVYRVTKWARGFTIIAALTLGSGWTYMTFFPPYAHGRLVFNPLMISTDVLLLAGFAYAIIWSLTARIYLYADQFEQHTPLIHRVLKLDDIAGRMYTKGSGAHYPMIVPKSGRPFSIDTAAYGLDERFNHWFLHLRDLNR